MDLIIGILALIGIVSVGAIFYKGNAVSYKERLLDWIDWLMAK